MNLKIVQGFENYQYNPEENKLFFSRSKKRVMQNINGNFILKKMGVAHEITVKRLITLTRTIGDKRTYSGLSGIQRKKKREELKQQICQDLIDGKSINSIIVKFKVGHSTVNECRAIVKNLRN